MTLNVRLGKNLQMPILRKEATYDFFVFIPVRTGFYMGYAEFHQTNPFMFLDVDQGLNLVTESVHLHRGCNNLWNTTPLLELNNDAGRKPDSQAIFKPKESLILAPRSSCLMPRLQGFSIAAISGQCAKAQKISFCH